MRYFFGLTQLNIFEGIFNNYYFGGVVLTIFCLQLLLVTFTGPAFSVYNYFGLHPIHWLMCVIFAINLDFHWFTNMARGLFHQAPAYR